MLDDTKQCPYCGETIKAKAVYCRYCRRNLPSVDNAPSAVPAGFPSSLQDRSFQTPVRPVHRPHWSKFATNGVALLLLVGLISALVWFQSPLRPYKGPVQQILAKHNLRGEITMAYDSSDQGYTFYDLTVHCDAFEELSDSEKEQVLGDLDKLYLEVDSKIIANPTIVSLGNTYEYYDPADFGSDGGLWKNGKPLSGSISVPSSPSSSSSSASSSSASSSSSSDGTDCMHSDHGITYIVYVSRANSTVSTISATWQIDSGGTNQGDYPLPFCRNYSGFSSGDFVYVSAQIASPTDSAGTITCKIYQDNYLLAEADASGFASIATCSGTAD